MPEKAPSSSPPFWSKVDQDSSPNGCWLWTGAMRSGYGCLTIVEAKRKYKQLYAHRWAWQELRGPIPDGLCVLHNCPGGDNKLCVNPSHLYLGTKGDNNEDARQKGQMARGDRHHQSKLTEETAVYAMARMLAGESQRSIAPSFGVSYVAIGQVWRGQAWGHVFNDNSY